MTYNVSAEQNICKTEVPLGSLIFRALKYLREPIIFKFYVRHFVVFWRYPAYIICMLVFSHEIGVGRDRVEVILGYRFLNVGGIM